MSRRIEWELLKPEEIEVRVQSVKNGKATMLLYQNSRTAMDAFNRQFGEFGWMMKYEAVGSQIYGILSVYDEERGIWVEKSDTGDESNISEKKGQSSDILKRCAVRWGYAMELYTAPKIQIDDDGYGNSGYRVDDIRYNDKRQIVYLKIVNRFGKEVFTWNTDTIIKNTPAKIIEQQKENKTDNYKTILSTKCRSMKDEGKYELDEIIKFFNYYTEALNKGWKGKEFNVDKLWDRWITPKSTGMAS